MCFLFQLDLQFYNGIDYVDTTDFMPSENIGFELIEHSAKKNVIYYPCCEEPYPDLTFTLKFKKI
jgi:hypothetical protein